MEERKLYSDVRRTLCRMIFSGRFPEGGQMPPERQLCEELGVSRVTLRKALTLLEGEGIISRVQGSGTRVSLNMAGGKGDMDIITLVAPARNAFFARFIDAFETEAEQHDCLVLFKQKPKGISLEDCLFQLYERGLRNIVLWPENLKIDENRLRLLRGLGMNLVCFDSVNGGPYADAVCLDNHDAIRRLYAHLMEQGCRHIGYVGWDNSDIGSVRERERVYRQLTAEPAVVKVPYIYHDCLKELSEEMIRQGRAQLQGCDGIICSVAELLRLAEPGQRIAVIDDLPEREEEASIRIRQDFPTMARRIFDCLARQNDPGVEWSAQNHYIIGETMQ